MQRITGWRDLQTVPYVDGKAGMDNLVAIPAWQAPLLPLQSGAAGINKVEVASWLIGLHQVCHRLQREPS